MRPLGRIAEIETGRQFARRDVRRADAQAADAPAQAADMAERRGQKVDLVAGPLIPAHIVVGPGQVAPDAKKAAMAQFDTFREAGRTGGIKLHDRVVNVGAVR